MVNNDLDNGMYWHGPTKQDTYGLIRRISSALYCNNCTKILHFETYTSELNSDWLQMLRLQTSKFQTRMRGVKFCVGHTQGVGRNFSKGGLSGASGEDPALFQFPGGSQPRFLAASMVKIKEFSGQGGMAPLPMPAYDLGHTSKIYSKEWIL